MDTSLIIGLSIVGAHFIPAALYLIYRGMQKLREPKKDPQTYECPFCGRPSEVGIDCPCPESTPLTPEEIFELERQDIANYIASIDWDGIAEDEARSKRTRRKNRDVQSEGMEDKRWA